MIKRNQDTLRGTLRNSERHLRRYLPEHRIRDHDADRADDHIGRPACDDHGVLPGGSLMGAGLGYVFLGKATTGGTDTLAALIQRAFPYLTAARIMPVLDGIIILLSVWIFGFRISMYAIITVVLCGRIADKMISGSKNAFLAYIISEKHHDIAQTILQEMDRGVTMLPATGVYTNQDRPVLLCAVSTRQAVVLRDIVSEIDPKAFFVLSDASEIRGEGFQAYSKEEF